MKIMCLFRDMDVGMIKLFWIGLSLAWAIPIGADDSDLARQMSEQGEILSLEQILQSHPALMQVKILEIELEVEDGQLSYEIEYLQQDGRIKEVYINATNAQIIKEEED